MPKGRGYGNSRGNPKKQRRSTPPKPVGKRRKKKSK
jgi:hypothetical protein